MNYNNVNNPQISLDNTVSITKNTDIKSHTTVNRQFDVKISQDIVNYLESLNYELESRKTIISHILSSGMSLDTEAAKRYQAEYKDFFIEYDFAKKELEIDNIPPELKEHQYTWNLDFKTQTMTFSKKCNC